MKRHCMLKNKKKVKKIVIAIIFVCFIFCSGCKDRENEIKSAMPSKITKSEAISIAQHAFEKTVPQDIAHKYHIQDITWSDGSWSMSFIDPNSETLGNHLLVIVNDEKKTEVLPGE